MLSRVRTELAKSLGVAFLRRLESHRRITLGEAVRVAQDNGMNEDDALTAIELLVRPRVKGLRRFYIDRSGDVPITVTDDEVRQRVAVSREAWRGWASQIEVVWAVSEPDAIGGGRHGAA
jgi:thioesterase domain-containing protein